MTEENKPLIDLGYLQECYKQAWGEYVEVDEQYQSSGKKRNELSTYLSAFGSVLEHNGIDLEKLKRDVVQVDNVEFDIEFVDLKEMSVPDAVSKILRESDEPLHYTEIFEKVIDMGIVVGGKKPAATILSYIHRYKSKFEQVPKKGKGYYQLKEWLRSREH